SEEHTSELQSLTNLVCRLLLEKKKPTGGSPANVRVQQEHVTEYRHIDDGIVGLDRAPRNTLGACQIRHGEHLTSDWCDAPSPPYQPAVPTHPLRSATSYAPPLTRPASPSFAASNTAQIPSPVASPSEAPPLPPSVSFFFFFKLTRPPPIPPFFPSTTLSR